MHKTNNDRKTSQPIISDNYDVTSTNKIMTVATMIDDDDDGDDNRC